jgi:predicted hotdog family 3-hydroxylacyl-ACP dehydratase
MTPEAVLALLPQQRPMRFVDEILELDDEHILGTSRVTRSSRASS